MLELAGTEVRSCWPFANAMIKVLISGALAVFLGSYFEEEKGRFLLLIGVGHKVFSGFIALAALSYV